MSETDAERLDRIIKFWEKYEDTEYPSGEDDMRFVFTLAHDGLRWRQVVADMGPDQKQTKLEGQDK